MQCLVVAAAVLPLLGLCVAAGHQHDLGQVEHGDCAACDLLQAEWLPDCGAPTLGPDSLSEARGATGFERAALDGPYLLEPVRGPPTRA